MSMHIDAARLQSRITELAKIGATPDGGVTRLSYLPDHADAVRLVARWMREAGADVGLDAWGNLFGVVPGSRGGLPSIAVGSHLDTVPNGGIFDGPLGTVAAVEVAAALRDERSVLRHPMLLLAFAEEEGVSFGVGCLGSLGAVGRAPAPESIRDAEGVSAADRLRQFDPGVPRRLLPASMAAYLELHIEQGPTLITKHIGIGAVSAIVGISRAPFIFVGEANHAGTTPMDARRDALWGAADLVGAVRTLARDSGGQAVGTIGRIAVSPGASNVVPGRAEVTVELRSPDASLIEQLHEQVQAAARACANRYGLALEHRPWRSEPPVPLNRSLRDEISAAADELGWPVLTMPSWAGHDAKILASLAPTGMIFVPSVGGISHSPREQTSWEDAACGTQVLCRTVERLDASSGGGE
jgi:beta-ureidopropionase / N-carbamoyl-L-amino-acid hydrolase